MFNQESTVVTATSHINCGVEFRSKDRLKSVLPIRAMQERNCLLVIASDATLQGLKTSNCSVRPHCETIFRIAEKCMVRERR